MYMHRCFPCTHTLSPTQNIYNINVKEKCVGRCWLQGILSCVLFPGPCYLVTQAAFATGGNKTHRSQMSSSSIAHAPPDLVFFSLAAGKPGDPSRVGGGLVCQPCGSLLTQTHDPDKPLMVPSLHSMYSSHIR